MSVAYPSTLPLALAEKTRDQVPAFSIAQPRRGFGYVEPTGTDVPVFWDLTWRFTEAQAQTFWQWFTFTTDRGVLPFTMQIRTEFGLIEHEVQFLPDSLLPAKALGRGAVWEYSARVMARALAGVTPPSGYAYFSAVVLQLHLDGTNGSTVFTDSSSYARVPSVASAGASISTAQSVYGGASLRVSGGGKLQYDTAAELALGTGAFCAEAWVRFDTLGSVEYIFGQTNTSGSDSATSIYARRNTSGCIEVGAFSGSTQICNIVGATVVPVNTWRHVAFTSSGGTFTLWLQGSPEGSDTDANPINASSYDFSIGAFGEFLGSTMTGYIDDFRWTVGANPYTTAFTPPTQAHPDTGL